MKMFTRHVTKKISAYIHGELDVEESRRVAGHLRECDRCRREHDEIKLGAHLAGSLTKLSAPAEMWGEIEALLDAQTRKTARHERDRRFALTMDWRYVAAASAVVILIAVVSIILLRRTDKNSEEVAGRPATDAPAQCEAWEVESLVGKIKIDDSIVSGLGCFRVGELLETDNGSRAKIKVAEIGHVELEPNSRVRLIETSDAEHRLALDRGTMHATIHAPPRLFFVNTPSAEAIDLGCAYTLEVDDDGRGFLHVTSGWVALVRDGRESFVPVGAMCETRPGVGPGTPFFDDASDEFRQALARFDFESGGRDALKVVLRLARDRDTFTLWQLLQRVDEPTRQKVLDRMIALVGLPEGITREGTMRLDPNMLELWKEEMDTVWF
jgi:FecR protein/Putative zinc-finger